MASFSHYEPCPPCREQGKDSRGDNLARWSDGSGHCFSCGHHVFPTHYIPVKKDDRPNDPKTLPADFSREIPGKAWQWLLQYGLSWRYWQPICGWSEKDSRLVFTIGTPVTASIGRFIDVGAAGQRDVPRKWHVYGNPKRVPELIGNVETAKHVVLVEDVISAHKLGQITLATTLFGTSVWDGLVPILRHLGLPIVMWLDWDQQNRARKRANALSIVTGLPVRYVFTKADPKSLSLDKIQEVLNDS